MFPVSRLQHPKHRPCRRQCSPEEIIVAPHSPPPDLFIITPRFGGSVSARRRVDLRSLARGQAAPSCVYVCGVVELCTIGFYSSTFLFG